MERPTSAKWLRTLIKRCSILLQGNLARRRQAVCEGRRLLRRWQEHLLRRPHQRSAVEPYDSRRGDLTSIIGLTVTGNPPMKPVSQYSVIGKSFPSSAVRLKVTGKANWATDVRLPGMLHGRTVHPKTLVQRSSPQQGGQDQVSNSQVIAKGNLVGVVAPTEWEAIQAAMQVADGTSGPIGRDCPRAQSCSTISATTPIGNQRPF